MIWRKGEKMEDLLTIAEAQIAEKQVKEIEEVKKRLDADRETIKEALKLVKDHTLYKKITTSHYSRKYVLATEDILKGDYLKKPKYAWQTGIKIKHADETKTWNTGILEVNGETYYDIRFALEAYEKRINARKSAMDSLEDRIRELEKEVAQLEMDFPSLKQAIMEWQNYVSQKEEIDHAWD